jgi:ADP-heptose:LPS heptosyltransferase
LEQDLILVFQHRLNKQKAMEEKWLYVMNLIVSRLVNAGKRKLWVGATGGTKGEKGLQLRNILVVKLDEIGDMATATHVFAYLKKAYPLAKITVLCKPFVESLIENDPHIDAVITNDADWKQSFDLVVELRGTWRTLFKSLWWVTMPKYRVDRGWIRLLQRGKQPHEILTNYRIIAPLVGDLDGFEVSLVQDLSFKPTLYPTAHDVDVARNWSDWATAKDVEEIDESNARVPLKGYAILHTGARRDLRRWDDQRFAELSQWIYHEKNLMPIWVGTADERVQIEAALALGGFGKMWIAGATPPFSSSLLAFYAFIEGASLYVGNESGPLQLADIAGIPTIGIFGPGVPDVFYPKSLNSRVLHEVLACNPCDQVHCVRPENRCVNLISIAAVKLAIEKVF